MSAVAEALRKKPTSGAVSISELWRGEVAEVFSDGTAQVIVPRLAGPDPVGRIESLVPNLAIGARVIVGAIEGRRDDLVVLSVLGADGTVIGPGAFTSVELANVPTLPSHAVRKDYADALGSLSADVNTIVRRGATGSIIVQDAYLGGVQAVGNAATTKTYVDAQVATRYGKTPTLLPSTAHDLNNYTTADNYHQPANAAASLSTNYPIALAGLLEVFASTAFVYQRYTLYNSGITYTRSKYNSTWYAWKEHSTVGHTHAYSSLTGLPATFPSDWATLANIPATFAPAAHTHAGVDVAAVTSSTQGAMLAADKVKLDAAAVGATPSTLVLRASSGRFDAADPTVATNVATKGYVDTQVGTRALSSHTHTYADISGTVPTSALPPLAVNEVFTVGTQAAMLALTAQRGDMAIRTDTGKSYALSTDSPGTLADWKELMAAGQVVSVAGKTGVVSLVKADVGLGNVDNTTDLLKPVSTATQAALNGKANSSHTHAAADLVAGDLTMSKVRLTATGDVSATSTGHAFQIGPDTGVNLIMDGNEIMTRNNGVMAETYFNGGVTSGTAPLGASSLTRKDYVDARTPNLTDAGSVVIALATGDVSKTAAITFTTPFTSPPKMSATITSNVAGRAAQLNAYAYSATTTGATLKLMTNDVAAIGTSFNISVDWHAIGN